MRVLVQEKKKKCLHNHTAKSGPSYSLQSPDSLPYSNRVCLSCTRKLCVCWGWFRKMLKSPPGNFLQTERLIIPKPTPQKSKSVIHTFKGIFAWRTGTLFLYLRTPMTLLWLQNIIIPFFFTEIKIKPTGPGRFGFSTFYREIYLLFACFSQCWDYASPGLSDVPDLKGILSF